MSLDSAQSIEKLIFEIRAVRVMLDSDLARLYGVSTTRLNEQVRRNLGRFPSDFMFRLTLEEYQKLESNSPSSNGRGGRRKPPLVFTEHGAIMLASVLNSPAAVGASIEVVRAFVKQRRWLASQVELFGKLEGLEQKYDRQFKVVFDAIRQLMEPVVRPRRKIGIVDDDQNG